MLSTVLVQAANRKLNNYGTSRLNANITGTRMRTADFGVRFYPIAWRFKGKGRYMEFLVVIFLVNA